jgi:hypothetical protein
LGRRKAGSIRCDRTKGTAPGRNCGGNFPFLTENRSLISGKSLNISVTVRGPRNGSCGPDQFISFKNSTGPLRSQTEAALRHLVF